MQSEAAHIRLCAVPAHGFVHPLDRVATDAELAQSFLKAGLQYPARYVDFIGKTEALELCCPAKQEPTEIIVGEFGSLTGSTATFGISTRNGVDMAIDETNQSGGILGKKIRVIVEDDQGKPEEAQTVVTKLVNKDRVVAVLGEVLAMFRCVG